MFFFSLAQSDTFKISFFFFKLFINSFFSTAKTAYFLFLFHSFHSLNFISTHIKRILIHFYSLKTLLCHLCIFSIVEFTEYRSFMTKKSLWRKKWKIFIECLVKYSNKIVISSNNFLSFLCETRTQNQFKMQKCTSIDLMSRFANAHKV